MQSRATLMHTFLQETTAKKSVALPANRCLCRLLNAHGLFVYPKKWCVFFVLCFPHVSPGYVLDFTPEHPRCCNVAWFGDALLAMETELVYWEFPALQVWKILLSKILNNIEI